MPEYSAKFISHKENTMEMYNQRRIEVLSCYQMFIPQLKCPMVPKENQKLFRITLAISQVLIQLTNEFRILGIIIRQEDGHLLYSVT